MDGDPGGQGVAVLWWRIVPAKKIFSGNSAGDREVALRYPRAPLAAEILGEARGLAGQSALLSAGAVTSGWNRRPEVG